MTASRIFFYFCLSFIGGIFLSSIFSISQPVLLAISILGILLISVLWQYRKFAVVGFCLLILVLGSWRHQVSELQIANGKLQIYNDTEEIITLIGIISKEPDVREKSIKLEIANLKLEIDNKWKDISGKVLVTAWRYPEYQYGDKLKITGKLETPEKFPKSEEDRPSFFSFAGVQDFNYKDYLAKEGIYSLTYFPEIELIKRNQGNFIFAKVLKFKQKLREAVYRNLSPPQSSILAAMILGDKRQLSEDLKGKLNIAGIRHITAISGMHVAILTAILMTILIGFGLWRQQAFYLTCFLIFFFISMTGFQPSAIRAGIMGFFFLLAQHLGRLNVSSRAVVFAGTIMLAQNPLLLRQDVGFQLSFLAILGIIYFGPVFQNWLKKLPDNLLGFLKLRSLLAMTFSAQIFTLPILIYNFGYFSAVAPLTNVLILPLLPFIMGLGFLFALAGILWQSLGWILSWPCWFLLTYLTKIIDFFSKIPWATLTFRISWPWLLIFYLILIYLTWHLNKKYRQPFFLR